MYVYAVQATQSPHQLCVSLSNALVELETLHRRQFGVVHTDLAVRLKVTHLSRLCTKRAFISSKLCTYGFKPIPGDGELLLLSNKS